MADPTMVVKNGSDANPATSSVSQRQNDIISTQRTKGAPSATQEAHIDSMSLVRGYLKDKGLSITATTVIEKAWRSGTRKQYATYLQKWKHHCTARGIDPFHPSVEAGINFLAVLFDSNIGCSAINTARSALSSIVMLPDDSQFGTHPLVCRFVKGVFELKPSLPKEHLGCKDSSETFIRISDASEANAKGTDSQNYYAFSFVIRTEMPNFTEAIR